MVESRLLKPKEPTTITSVAFALFIAALVTMGTGKVVHERFSSHEGGAIFLAGCAILLISVILAIVGHFRK